MCDNEKCREKSRACIFKQPNVKVDEKSYKALQTYFNSKKADKPLIPDGKVFMKVYANAMAGHQESLKLLLNKTFLRKIDNQMENEGDPSDGAVHAMTSKTLKILTEAKCL